MLFGIWLSVRQMIAVWWLFRADVLLKIGLSSYKLCVLLESSTSLCYDSHCSPLLFFPITIRLVGLTLSNAC